MQTAAMKTVAMRIMLARWDRKTAKGGAAAATAIWWRFRDSNPGPADYDSVALTD